MAVYTILERAELESLLARYDLHGLNTVEGASSGIENTTFFLTLDSGAAYVLTVFEQLSTQQLTPYVALTALLRARALPVPSPLHDTHGLAMQSVHSKPALLFERASGQHLVHPSAESCASVGAFLARMHSESATISAHDFPGNAVSGSAWMQQVFVSVEHMLDAGDCRLMHETIALSMGLEKLSLPRGIIHGDLFRDNVLFDGRRISAVIDFYNADRDILLLDLAIAGNDWCFAAAPDNPLPLCNALLDAYVGERPLTQAEQIAWPACLQVAAARFWLSRLKRVADAQQGSLRKTKNPEEYRQLLLRHRHSAPIK